MSYFRQLSLTLFETFLNIRQDFLQIRNSRSTDLFHNTDFNLYYTAAHLLRLSCSLTDCVLLTPKFNFLKPFLFCQKNVIRRRFSSTKSSLRFAPSFQVTAILFKCSTTCISTVTAGSARLKLYMHNQFHSNTKMHIHFTHTILRIIETTPKYNHTALPEAHNPAVLFSFLFTLL